ncbi:MAG: alpha/beta hydrolase [Chitinophagales bacterium]
MGWLILSFIILYVLYCLAFILLQPYLIFRPEKLKDDYVFNLKVSFQELNTHAADGTKLNGILLQPEAKKGIIIYFHGNWKNLDNYLPFTKKFTDLGFSVLLPDYRSYGKSEGRLTEQLFFSDTEHWYRIAVNICAAEKIFIYGRSLGTAAATYLAAHQPCRQLILETPFANMYDIGRRYGMLFPDGNYLRFSFRTDVLIQSVKIPILILHGNKDEVVSIKSGKKLKQFLKERDQFVVIENGRHKNLHQFQAYHLALNNFLDSGEL